MASARHRWCPPTCHRILCPCMWRTASSSRGAAWRCFANWVFTSSRDLCMKPRVTSTDVHTPLASNGVLRSTRLNDNRGRSPSMHCWRCSYGQARLDACKRDSTKEQEHTKVTLFVCCACARWLPMVGLHCDKPCDSTLTCRRSMEWHPSFVQKYHPRAQFCPGLHAVHPPTHITSKYTAYFRRARMRPLEGNAWARWVCSCFSFFPAP